MRDAAELSMLDWRGLPTDALASWPADRPLLMIHSGRSHARWARWSILASPVVRFQFDGCSRWIGSPPDALAKIKFTHHPLADLDAVIAATRCNPDAPAQGLPFAGGWIGYFSYDLGRWIEPRAQSVFAVDDRRWPLIDLAWCPDALAFDHEDQQWWAAGEMREAQWLVAAIDARQREWGSSPRGFTSGQLRALSDDQEYMAIVRRTIEYIRAGDIFQANLARRFTASFSGSPRELALAAMHESKAWYGAYLELPGLSHETSHPDRWVISLSPELFLEVNANGRVITRPIKGTLPASAHPDELARSAKDAAELHMIVDLMRNDLGRVCEIGSVRVNEARIIESHPTVHHGVGEVTGQMRSNATFVDLLRATFPGGSVTGAPKIRAMQVIDELEPVRRGPYCGAIGYIGDHGIACFNIAIRTALLQGRSVDGRCDEASGTLDYSAGAGIVADSQPESECAESLAKLAVLQLAMRRFREPVPAGAQG